MFHASLVFITNQLTNSVQLSPGVSPPGAQRARLAATAAHGAEARPSPVPVSEVWGPLTHLVTSSSPMSVDSAPDCSQWALEQRARFLQQTNMEREIVDKLLKALQHYKRVPVLDEEE